MALHWSVWLIVGAGVALFSDYIGDKFILFFYVGIIFVIIGVVKAIVALILGQKKPRETVPHPSVASGTVHPAHTQQPAVPTLLKQTIYICPRCRYQVGPAARFCQMCGLKIR